MPEKRLLLAVTSQVEGYEHTRAIIRASTFGSQPASATAVHFHL
jgi:hypothetical protein